MRAFRFSSRGSVATSQRQTIECSIHLEPIDEISREQEADCTCHTEDECKSKHLFIIQKLILRLNLFNFYLIF